MSGLPVPDWYIRALPDDEIRQYIDLLNVTNSPDKGELSPKERVILGQLKSEQVAREGGYHKELSPILTEEEAQREAARYPKPFLAPRPLKTHPASDAEAKLAEFLKQQGFDFIGITGAAKNPNGDHAISDWNSLDWKEKQSRVASGVFEVFQAMQKVVKVDGRENAGKRPLAVHISSMETVQTHSQGTRLGGVYDASVNTLAVDINSSNSLIHEFGHYMDFAAGSRYKRVEGHGVAIAATQIVSTWHKFVNDLKDTPAHHHYVFTSGVDPQHTQAPTEVFARFFEGWVMHENLKDGTDLYPGIGMAKDDKGNIAALNNQWRNRLNHEPYTYDQFEQFGARLRGLLKESELANADICTKALSQEAKKTKQNKPGTLSPATHNTENDFVPGKDKNIGPRYILALIKAGLGYFLYGGGIISAICFVFVVAEFFLRPESDVAVWALFLALGHVFIGLVIRKVAYVPQSEYVRMLDNLADNQDQ